MEKLLIICKTPFGHLTDVVKWCEYAASSYDIKVVGMANKTSSSGSLPDNIQVVQSPFKGNVIVRGVLFLMLSVKSIFSHNGKIMVVYFPGCQLLKLFFPFRRMLLDIRTLAVVGNRFQRWLYNFYMKLACLLYNKISVISQGVKDDLGLVCSKAYILPLGADIISSEKKDYSQLRLLYVGTLKKRRIEDTITGVAEFKKGHPDVDLHYDIVGDGFEGQVEKYRELTEKLGISKSVKLHGRKNHAELQSFFDASSVGVSYVPVTCYYNHQPPTKTYEYVLSGLYTIATATAANRLLINENNGYIIGDSSTDFTLALEHYFKINNEISEEKIRDSLSFALWHNVVDVYLLPIINKL